MNVYDVVITGDGSLEPLIFLISKLLKEEEEDQLKYILDSENI